MAVQSGRGSNVHLLVAGPAAFGPFLPSLGHAAGWVHCGISDRSEYRLDGEQCHVQLLSPSNHDRVKDPRQSRLEKLLQVLCSLT